MASSIKITPTHYEQDGIRYDRITEVIGTTWPKPELQDWRAQVGKARANRDLRHAEHIGKVVDEAITAVLAGRLPKPFHSAEVKQAMRGFGEWHDLNPIKPVAMQIPLLNPTRGIGGTPDCLTLPEGFDWKTSARFNFTQILQADQYWRLATLYGYELRQFRLVRFDKILGTWEELILMPNGIQWNERWISRDFLGQTFDTLLTLYRQWQYVNGQGCALPESSLETITEAV